jgi:hypothetical protein
MLAPQGSELLHDACHHTLPWSTASPDIVCPRPRPFMYRYVARNSNVALLRWRFWAMAPIAATLLQRAYRGHLGRVEANVLRKLRDSTMLIVSGNLSRGRPLRLPPCSSRSHAAEDRACLPRPDLACTASIKQANPLRRSAAATLLPRAPRAASVRGLQAEAQLGCD